MSACFPFDSPAQHARLNLRAVRARTKVWLEDGRTYVVELDLVDDFDLKVETEQVDTTIGGGWRTYVPGRKTATVKLSGRVKSVVTRRKLPPEKPAGGLR